MEKAFSSDSDELIVDPMPWISGYLSGRDTREKEYFIRNAFRSKTIDRDHEALGYWFVWINQRKIGIFSLTKNSFLKLPHEIHGSEYFSDITSLGVSGGYSDNVILLTFSLGGITSPKDTYGIDLFCYVEDDIVRVFEEMPMNASASLASKLFYVRRRMELAWKQANDIPTKSKQILQ